MIRATPIVPKDFKVGAFLSAIEKESKEIGKEMLGQYEKFTATWKHKPRFTLTVKVTREKVTILVTTKDKIFEYVAKGTRPHIIRAKNAVALRFQSGYKAKTRKGLVGSLPGGASGGDVYAKVVQHPGTEGREPDKAIARVYSRVMHKRYQTALNRAAQASGHSMRR